MASQVLGLEAVLPDGSVYSNLIPLRKDNRGFDLKQLLIGSEGTIGVITTATLRLLPAVAERTVIWIGIGSLEEAREVLLFCEARLGRGLEGFEVLSRACLDTVLKYLPGARCPVSRSHNWHALVEVVDDGSYAGDLSSIVEAAISAAYSSGLLTDAAISTNETQAEAFWHLRESISGAALREGLATQHDISVPMDRMPAFIDHALGEVAAKWPDVKCLVFGHLGDGNIHFHLVAPKNAEKCHWTEKALIIDNFIYDLVIASGGSISAEHGIGQLKLSELYRSGDPTSLWMLSSVKKALDPHDLLNPGKLVRQPNFANRLAKRGHPS